MGKWKLSNLTVGRANDFNLLGKQTGSTYKNVICTWPLNQKFQVQESVIQKENE